MLLQQPFVSLTPTVDGDVLQVLAGSRDEFTVSRLARLVPHRSVSGIRNTLERLWEHGLVTMREVGRTRGYALNDLHLLAGAVRSIADARGALLRRLGEHIGSWEYPATYGALFGSAARGEMGLESDIDIFLVCPDSNDQDWGITIADLIVAVTGWTGNEARVVEIHEAEVGALEHRPLLESIVREGVTFAGDPGWLRNALRGAAA